MLKINIDTLGNYIKKGFSNNYYLLQYMNPLGGHFQTNTAEYGFNISIAKEIIEWRKEQKDYNLSIVFEYSVKELANNAFPRFTFFNKDIIESGIKRRQLHIVDNRGGGRVDIAVLSTKHGRTLEGVRSIAAIEVKPFNPAKSLVIEDINRLVEVILKHDDIEDNSIKACYVVYGKRLDELGKPYEEEQKKQLIRSFDESVASLVQASDNAVSVSIDYDIFIIDEYTANNYVEDNQHEEYDVDYAEVSEATGLNCGALITIKRKTT